MTQKCCGEAKEGELGVARLLLSPFHCASQLHCMLLFCAGYCFCLLFLLWQFASGLPRSH